MSSDVSAEDLLNNYPNNTELLAVICYFGACSLTPQEHGALAFDVSVPVCGYAGLQIYMADR